MSEVMTSARKNFRDTLVRARLSLRLRREFVHHLLRRAAAMARLIVGFVDGAFVEGAVISIAFAARRRSIGKCFSAHHESNKSPPLLAASLSASSLTIGILPVRVQLSLYIRRPRSQFMNIGWMMPSRY